MSTDKAEEITCTEEETTEQDLNVHLDKEAELTKQDSEGCASSKSLSSPSKVETSEALQHLVQGKRHLLVRDVHSAVGSLQEACRLLAEQYGETADPCGEAYFVYGKALLELSRIETGVLGNALDGDSADGDGDDDESGEEDASSAGAGSAAETGAAEAGSAEASSADGEGSTNEAEGSNDGASAGEKEGDVSQDCDTAEDGEGARDEDGDGGEDDEEVPSIQLAWEVLELAKVIFTRQAGDKQSDLKLSEVYLKLGEVSIEAENYTQAVQDLHNCLRIQEQHLPADDRLVAETHYQLGVAHSLANEYSQAIGSLRSSVDTITARIQRLNRQALERDQGKATEQHENPFYTEENEIKELEELLPDIREKIADMMEMKAEAQKKIAELFASGAGPSGSTAPISPVKVMMTSRPAAAVETGGETRSISHLVKRKRLSGELDKEETKRPKQENGHGGNNAAVSGEDS